jgi:acetate---CoA ligase (ADP-forming)
VSDLRTLFAPRGVAVVGASRDGAKLGAVMARALAGYGQGCVLVNSRHPDPAAGVFASVAEAATHRPIDLAVLCVPAAATPGALADAAAAGVGAALVCAGGFGEAGPTGAAYERDLAEVARTTGVRVLGPNTSGFFAPARGLMATFVPGAAQVPAGGVAVVASSGGVNHALAFDLAEVGVSLAVGIGGGLDVRATDVLDHLATDPDTTAVALHVETVPDGPRLLAAVRMLSAVKPVVALVVGRADVGDFARSHTGALATSWRTARAALRQAGAVIVDDERELVDAVTALSAVRLAPAEDPGVGVVTAQAGPGLLLVDRLRTGGLRVPELTETTQTRLGELLPPLTYQRNPVDTGRPDKGFTDVLRAVAEDPGVDVLVGYALSEPDSLDLVAAARDGLPAATPAVLATGGPRADIGQVRARLRELGVPMLDGPTPAANAVRALVADARARALDAGLGEVVADPAPPIRPMWTFGDVVDEAQAKEFLATLGIRVPAGRVCRDRAEAAQALAELGVPVAVKILDATVTHKTDVGGVHLNVLTEADLDVALARMTAARAQHEWTIHVPGGPPISTLPAGTDTAGQANCTNGPLARTSPESGTGMASGPPESSLSTGTDNFGGRESGDPRYLVEAMASPGVELVVGARRDPVFGPIVLLGLGGTTAEALADVTIRVGPLGLADAVRMPGELAGAALLAGWRGGPVLDRDELARVLVTLGSVLVTTPELDEIEINPLRVTDDGLIALDCVVAVKEARE